MDSPIAKIAVGKFVNNGGIPHIKLGGVTAECAGGAAAQGHSVRRSPHGGLRRREVGGHCIPCTWARANQAMPMS